MRSGAVLETSYESAEGKRYLINLAEGIEHFGCRHAYQHRTRRLVSSEYAEVPDERNKLPWTGAINGKGKWKPTCLFCFVKLD
jgi:hypothetical protein